MSVAAKPKRKALFPTTQWADILAKRGDEKRREILLADLCQQYWRPLHTLARLRGLSIEASEDLVQEVFAKLLASDFLGALDPARGRLRSYLRKVMENALSHQRERAAAKKRGGALQTVSLDLEWAERSLADSSVASPDLAYDRAWARQVMESAFAELRAEFESGKRKGSFKIIETVFSAASTPPYARVAADHDMTVPQLKSFVHRARLRFRELVLAEVSQTVSHPSDAPAEMSSLIAALFPDR